MNVKPKPGLNGGQDLLVQAMRRAAQDIEKRQVAPKNRDKHLKEEKSGLGRSIPEARAS